MTISGVILLLLTIYCFVTLPRALFTQKYLREYDRYVLQTIKRRSLSKDIYLFLPIVGIYLTFETFECTKLKIFNLVLSIVNVIWLIASILTITVNETFFAYYSLFTITSTIVLTSINCFCMLYILGGRGLVLIASIAPPVAVALGWHLPKVFLRTYADELRGTFNA